MIKPWYERLDFPFARTFDVDGEVSTNSQVYYNPESNIILNKIAKNCTSSFEILGGYHGYREVSIYCADIINSPVKPTVYTILRDPVDRFISAVNMLIDQYQSFGLSLKPENFMALDHVTDMHLIPQINRVMQVPHTDDLLVFRDSHFFYQFKTLYTWGELYRDYPYLKYLDTLDQKFYYMGPGQDPILDIFDELGLTIPPQMPTKINARTDQPHQYCESISPELEQYVKNFYEPDYKLIELVNFQNK